MLQEVKVAHNSSSKKMGNEDRRLDITSADLILWSSHRTAACAGVSQWTHCQFFCTRSHKMPLFHRWRARVTHVGFEPQVFAFYENFSASILPLDSE